jgi:mannose/fructose/N-acetylgalactosamine-specific phosphotransferase system component IID
MLYDYYDDLNGYYDDDNDDLTEALNRHLHYHPATSWYDDDD